MSSVNEQLVKQYATTNKTISHCLASLSVINHLKNKTICERFITFIKLRTSPLIRHQLARAVNSSWRALAANSVLRLIISVTNALSLCAVRGAQRGPPVMEPEQVLRARWHQGGVHWQEFLMNFNYWSIKANELNEQPEYICETAWDKTSELWRDFFLFFFFCCRRCVVVLLCLPKNTRGKEQNGSRGIILHTWDT